jgi:hypothetical protein
MGRSAARAVQVIATVALVSTLLLTMGPQAAGAGPHRSDVTRASSTPVTWRNVTGTQPPFEQGAPMAYDPLLHAVILVTLNSTKFACQMYTYSYSNGSWTNLTSTVAGSPGVTQHAGFVYDASDHYMLMFGGYDNCNGGTGGTWAFSNNSWRQINTSGAPPMTEDFGMAYDHHDGYVLVYGRDSSAKYPNNHQTWAYHAGVWKRQNTTLFPAAAADVQMAPGPGGGVLAFGGGGGYNPLSNATWNFVSGQWHQLHPLAEPPATAQGLMGYSSNQGEVLFGGYQASVGYENFTYLYHGGVWVNLTTSLRHSPPIAYAQYFSGAFDVASGHYVVFLSPNGAGSAMSTWAPT